MQVVRLTVGTERGSAGSMNEVRAEQIAGHVSTGPRYTSYPPATAFGEFAPDVVRQQWAALAPTARDIGLYVHIPFCRQLCWYCGCNVVVAKDPKRADTYVDALASELATMRSAVGPQRLVEIALGGGSPNFLSARNLDTLMRAIDAFEIAPDARRSVELDPRDTTPEMVAAFAAHGFRSASMGVQDFAEAVQAAIGRTQSVAQTKSLIDTCRATGFFDMNIDLVYGLPHQTPASLRETIRTVIELGPDRIAVFGYAHLPERNPKQKLLTRDVALPGLAERAELLLQTTAQLESAGYIAVGIDHFAKPGSELARAAKTHRLTRNFQGYVTHQSDYLLGVGASAISSTPTAIWQNALEVPAWQASALAGQPTVARGVALTPDDQVRRDVITELMCHGEVDLANIALRHGVVPEVYFREEIAAFSEANELAHFAAPLVLQATPLGLHLRRKICQAFDRRSAQTGATFSLTV